MTTPSRTDRQELTEPQTVFADKLLRARDELAAEPGLSAEQVEEMRRGLLADAFWSEQQDEDHWSDERINTLCDMALRSLTARDEGIEAAAKVCDEWERKLSHGGGYAIKIVKEHIRALKGQP